MLIYMRFFVILGLLNLSLFCSEFRRKVGSIKRDRAGGSVLISKLDEEPSCYEADSEDSGVRKRGLKRSNYIFNQRSEASLAQKLGLLGYVSVVDVAHPNKSLNQRYGDLIDEQYHKICQSFCNVLNVEKPCLEQAWQHNINTDTSFQAVVDLKKGIVVVDDVCAVDSTVNHVKTQLFCMSGDDNFGKKYLEYLGRINNKSILKSLVWLRTLQQTLKTKEQERFVLSETIDRGCFIDISEGRKLERIAQRWIKATFDIHICMVALKSDEESSFCQQVLTPVNYVQDYLAHEARQTAFRKKYDPRTAWTVHGIVQDFHNPELTRKQREERSDHRFGVGPTQEELQAFEEKRFGK